MRFWVISQFPRVRIGIYLDYSVAHGPEAMPPAYAARETPLLAPGHSGGRANDVSHGPPSSCRALEIKSGRPVKTSGIEAFRKRYPKAEIWLIGGGGVKLDDFFNRPALEWFK